MSRVLTAASTVSCAHGGTVKVTGSPLLTVAGAGVLTVAGVAGAPLTLTVVGISTCGLTVQANPPTKKCLHALDVTAGTTARLTVGGLPVLVDTGFAGTTDGTVSGVTPQPGLTAVANQRTLTVGTHG